MSAETNTPAGSSADEQRDGGGAPGVTPHDQLAADRSVETPRVLVFFDYACPFCYLDWPRFERLRDEHGAELVLCPLELRPDLPERGITVEELGAGHSERVKAHMERMAAEGGLCFEDRDRLPNSHRALALGELGRDLGLEAHLALHRAIFEAYYCAGEDIGDMDVVLGIARDQGLDVDAVRDALERGVYDERLEQFRQLAHSLGVSATPSALICNMLVIGSRPYELLQSTLRSCVEHAHEHAGGLVEERLGREDEGEPSTVRGY